MKLIDCYSVCSCTLLQNPVCPAPVLHPFGGFQHRPHSSEPLQDTTAWSWFKRFEVCAAVNKWDAEKKLRRLSLLLCGQAWPISIPSWMMRRLICKLEGNPPGTIESKHGGGQVECPWQIGMQVVPWWREHGWTGQRHREVIWIRHPQAFLQRPKEQSYASTQTGSPSSSNHGWSIYDQTIAKARKLLSRWVI